MATVCVMTARTLAEVSVAGDSLRAADLHPEVRGSGRPGLAGEIPVVDARVELWVPAEEEERARGVLTEIDRRAHLEWVCGGCAERNPASFEVCWSCGREA